MVVEFGKAAFRLTLALTLVVSLMPSLAFATTPEAELEQPSPNEEQSAASSTELPNPDEEQGSASLTEPPTDASEATSSENIKTAAPGDIETTLSESIEEDGISIIENVVTEEATATPPSDPTPMEVGATYTVETTDGEYGYYSFTAPESGTYEFYSKSGRVDPRAWLYSDSAFSNLVASDDDSKGERNYSITYAMEAGQTVYLRAGEYSGGATSFPMTVERINGADLSHATVEMASSPLSYTGEPVDVGLTVSALDGSVLEEGVHYSVSYATSDGAPCAQPSDVGEYLIIVTAVEGGGYEGSTSRTFAIADIYDIGSGAYYNHYSNFIIGIDEEPSLQMWLEGDSSQIQLIQGTHFEIIGYNINDEVSPNPPTTEGWHTAVVSGISPYRGTTSIGFEAYLPTDLRAASVSFNGKDYLEYQTYTGNPVDLGIQITAPDGTVLEEGVHYEVVYTDQNGIPIEEAGNAPAEPGGYQVYARHRGWGLLR